jgi:superfamily I DNA and/or RNA helicase
MFDISNRLSYASEMVQATLPGESDIARILGPSGWFNVAGASNGNWCPDETELALRLLRKLADAGKTDPDVFIITPFRHVEANTRRLIGSERTPVDRFTNKPRDWARERVGTVHTFQGKQAEAVILILGASNPDQSGARNWAGSPPNLVNVAVSRAQKALYVIGNRSLWEGHGSFGILAQYCPVRSL